MEFGTLPSAHAEAHPLLRPCRYRQDHGIEILCGGAQGHQTFLARRGRRPWRAGPEQSSVRRPVDGDGACPSASPEAGRHRTAQGRHQRARDLVRREGRHARRTRRIHVRGQSRRRGFRRRPTARQAVHEFQLGFQGERDLQGGVAPSHPQHIHATGRGIQSAHPQCRKSTRKERRQIAGARAVRDRRHRQAARRRSAAPLRRGHRAASGRRHPRHLHGADRPEIRRRPGRPARCRPRAADDQAPRCVRCHVASPDGGQCAIFFSGVPIGPCSTANRT